MPINRRQTMIHQSGETHNDGSFDRVNATKRDDNVNSETKSISHASDNATVCELHRREREWCECWQCAGDGLYGHDICRGKGGWWRCYTCAPRTDDDF